MAKTAALCCLCEPPDGEAERPTANAYQRRGRMLFPAPAAHNPPHASRSGPSSSLLSPRTDRGIAQLMKLSCERPKDERKSVTLEEHDKVCFA